MFFALITTVLRFVLLQFILLAMSNMRARNYDKTKLTTERGFYCLRRLRCVDTNGLIRIVYYWLLNGDHFMSNDKSIGCWSWWGRNFLLRNLPSLEGPTRSQSFLTRLSLSTFDKRNELLDISNWLNPLKCAALHNFIFYTVSQFRCTVFVCQD